MTEQILEDNELELIPSDVVAHVLFPSMTNMTISDVYKYKGTSRAMYIRFLRIPIDEVGEWATTREPWFSAIDKDDDFFFGRLLRCFHTRRIRLSEYVGEEYDEDTRESYPIYDEIVINKISAFEKYIVSVDDLLTYCYESNAKKIFVLLYNDILFGKKIKELMKEDTDFLNYGIALAAEDSNTMSQVIEDHVYEESAVILNLATIEDGPRGLHMVLSLFIEKEIYLSEEFVDSMIEEINEGVYTGWDNEELSRLYREYPYVGLSEEHDHEYEEIEIEEQ